MRRRAAPFRMRRAILHLKKADAILGGLIEKIGPESIEYSEPSFETLAKAIVYQQLSGKAAATIFNRLAAAAANGRLTAPAVLRLKPTRMRTLGLSRQKIAYLGDLARRTVSGELDFGALGILSDDAVIERLTAVKGVGVWTAHMFLIFALRRPDVMPSGDLGIRAAVKKLYGYAETPPPTEVERLAAPWHPYCTLASWYLWRSLEEKAGL